MADLVDCLTTSSCFYVPLLYNYSDVNSSIACCFSIVSFVDFFLHHDIKMTRKSEKTMAFVYKTNNMYRLSRDQYNMLLNISITSTYKISNNNIKKKINISGRNILKPNEVLIRMDINGENNSFITLKDHNKNFESNPSMRLMKPAKNGLGALSNLIM